MAKKKGADKTGGRKKGTPNRKTLEVAEMLRANGHDPHMPFLFWARVLRSAMTPFPAKGKPDTAEQFYQGTMIVSDGKDAGSHVEPIYGRASASMADAAASGLARYVAPTFKSIEFKDDQGNTITPTMVDFTTLVKAIEHRG